MEEEKGAGSLINGIKPPRIEDAGLEDCALPPESIREAFMKAALAVGSLNSAYDDGDESESEDQRKVCADSVVGLSVAAHSRDSAAESKLRSDALVGPGLAEEDELKIGEESRGISGNKVRDEAIVDRPNSVS